MKQNNLETDGFAVAPQVISEAQIEKLQKIIAQIEGAGVSKRQSVFAIRNLLNVPAIQDLARSQLIRALIEPVLGPNCFAARGIFFDKTPDANWKVPFHQDLSIAVKSRIESPGFGPWSEKAGALHVQPPREILEQMLTIRLHLDACNADNGALRVIPNSHLLGKLDAAQIARQSTKNEEIASVASGGAMLMRPLLLHASSPSQSPAHRRVIHLEFAAALLPAGLEWLHRV
ncbi:Phytanoyl-CoA dioxygenase (PhyH) [Abditibacterium utsteinense]|uniref:Phytanoyl-CoA dioxygenase (PhyH) n=1 Tax=Abditibacterium utsteinense TaxID=1960156 RepID=A0A2S8SSS7_9BACT|nr:phytanoyl-CoA dioxygenase family protein [Abditibacterium utsteinense]PQV63863.1 Phytanoyl-CoA dioxygenase (PhyH) [Abditibacterium utsteinense]